MGFTFTTTSGRKYRIKAFVGEARVARALVGGGYV